MVTFGRLVNYIVITGMVYLTFIMALAGWIASLKKGQAVTLLPDQNSSSRNLWLQMTVVVLGLVIAIALIYWLWIPIPIHFSPLLSSVLTNVGLIFFVFGTFVVAWARQILGRMWGISTSRQVRLLPDHQIVKSGPYNVIRHPMYSGWWLALLGALLIYHTWALVLMLLLSIISFSRRARLEEKVLSEHFGNEWEAYTTSTKALLPWIY